MCDLSEVRTLPMSSDIICLSYQVLLSTCISSMQYCTADARRDVDQALDIIRSQKYASSTFQLICNYRRKIFPSYRLSFIADYRKRRELQRGNNSHDCPMLLLPLSAYCHASSLIRLKLAYLSSTRSFSHNHYDAVQPFTA